MLPDALKRLPPEDIINSIMKKIWINIGLMSDIRMSVDEGRVEIKTKNEGMTELIGKNSFLLGFHEGIMNALYGRDADVLEYSQSKKECTYQFRIKENAFAMEGKTKDEYNRLNRVQKITRPTLDDMLKTRVFTLDGNRMYFRGRVMYPIENTAIHLFSNQGPMLEKIPGISHDFFRKVLDRDSCNDDKLRLLRSLIQSMGWGTLSISKEADSIRIRIENPPYGLQKEKDNWKFLVDMINGYIMALDENYAVDSISQGHGLIRIGISK